MLRLAVKNRTVGGTAVFWPPTLSLCRLIYTQLKLFFWISVLLGALEHELNESRAKVIFTRAQSSDEDDTRSRIAVLLLECAISGRSAVW